MWMVFRENLSVELQMEGSHPFPRTFFRKSSRPSFERHSKGVVAESSLDGRRDRCGLRVRNLEHGLLDVIEDRFLGGNRGASHGQREGACLAGRLGISSLVQATGHPAGLYSC